jgi:uncharacterized membrane protein YeaQ/YmgE (transglycosylase-associated protein family)
MLHFIGFIIIGGIAGWVAGKLMTGHGYGPIIDVLLGVVGGVIGGWILGLITHTLGTNRPEGFVVQFVVSLVGASLLVAILHLIRREPLRAP